MKRWTAILVLLLAGCSQPAGTPVAAVTPTPTSSPTPTATAGPSGKGVPPSPSTSPSPDLPLTTVDISCRLPAVDVVYPQFKGGFITFPAGTFAFDLKGGFSTDPQTGVVSTVATPILKGEFAGIGLPFYDAAQGRWVPAGAGASTPDGAFYAYSTWDPAQSNVAVVHIVDVARATEKTFKVTIPVTAQGFSVGDFDSRGVYLLSNGFEQLPEGVWLMNPTTGSLQRLLEVGHVAAVRGGYAWAAAIDPRDPSPPQLRRSGTPSDSIVRVDLRTGAQSVWFYRPGKQVSLNGFDSSAHPIVQVFDPNDSSGYIETWLAGDPSNPTQIYAGHLYLGVPQGDGERIWFSGIAGLYLYTASAGLRKVAAFNLQDNESIVVVGFCA